MKFLLGIFLFILIRIAVSYHVNPGPLVQRTFGEVWPKPRKQVSQQEFSVLLPSRFKFMKENTTSCDILDAAFERYYGIIAGISNQGRKNNKPSSGTKMREYRYNSFYAGNLDVLKIILRGQCESEPYLGMNEDYSLTIANDGVLESKSVWGILRGLETFSQLLTYAGAGSGLRLNHTQILDGPVFPWRGLLVDTSRHFVKPPILYQILDGMAYNKLNVFHWHITDDQSFPYESTTFPELSAQGAYHPRLVYTQVVIANVIEFARLRGIRVVVEFDTPGHTRSWGVSHPELLTECGEPLEPGSLGPIDPTNEGVYTFLNKFFSEVVKVFPDRYVHLGGDEVDFDCWQSNQKISDWMTQKGITKYEKLEELFIQKIIDQIAALNASSVVWQEVFQNGVKLPSETIVQVWTGNTDRLMKDVTKAGHPVLLSACWYLDHVQGGGDWKKYYGCDPLAFNGTPEMMDLVWGGEACMWAEVVDSSNILQRIFPRVCAAAERLWTSFATKAPDFDEAARRLEEHYCRMNQRGIPAQPPNGPGFCSI